ncbi:hypothetical protein JHK87_047894 [Glycine soja]|nr:hypothetical protein JHK87_047894 [Glycine soja]
MAIYVAMKPTKFDLEEPREQIHKTSGSGLRDLLGCPLRLFTSLPGSPFVVKMLDLSPQPPHTYL